ncbi:uncharacterized protein BXIN_2233 [Babesia sp. Xinjiang]|uniref:uncharacterized protein n=1 Tax=Babesia sp. Xinjiang TaxID=462227 RepID=UPI000A2467BA|nr:uncharacterized protein BXIN_2233 [Babesia sp. Xinjiang]ORM40776.1 hypothetical protein BXIN_2233 [Babesia sp. Xinjiang]
MEWMRERDKPEAVKDNLAHCNRKLRFTSLVLSFISISFVLFSVQACPSSDDEHQIFPRTAYFNATHDSTTPGLRARVAEFDEAQEKGHDLLSVEKSVKSSQNDKCCITSPASVDDKLSLDERNDYSKVIGDFAKLTREMYELRLLYEDVIYSIKMKRQNVATLSSLIEQLRSNNNQLLKILRQHNARSSEGSSQKHLSGKQRILRALTIAECLRGICIVFRVPFVLLKQHFWPYTQVEEIVGLFVSRNVAAAASACSRVYENVYVSGVDKIFNWALTHLRAYITAHASLQSEHMAMRLDLEDYIKREYNFDATVFSNDETRHWSINRIRSLLYLKLGLRHCMYWWYALVQDSNKHVRGNYTLSRLLMAVYGQKFRIFCKRIEVYLLWLAASSTFSIWNPKMSEDDIQSIQNLLVGLYGPIVLSPFTIREWFIVVSVALNRLIKHIDNELKMLYTHLTAVYPEFVHVCPVSLKERLYMTLAIVCIAAFLAWLSVRIICCVVAVVHVFLAGLKRLNFVYSILEKFKHWYQTSFLRWSFTLLQNEPGEVRPLSQGKGRKKLRNAHIHGLSDETHALNFRKAGGSVNKTTTFWNTRARRDRLRDTYG